MSNDTITEKAAEKAAKDARTAENDAKEKQLNEGKTGKGLRFFIGMTRGRNPQPIQYEGFDETQPDTLPDSLSEFMSLTKTQDEKVIVGYLVDGFNSAAYTAASDPVAEFVDASWDEDIKKNFRTVVRNYAQGVKVSIEDAVALIKPAYLASQTKK